MKSFIQQIAYYAYKHQNPEQKACNSHTDKYCAKYFYTYQNYKFRIIRNINNPFSHLFLNNRKMDYYMAGIFLSYFTPAIRSFPTSLNFAGSSGAIR